jgi:hypothetical protein
VRFVVGGDTDTFDQPDFMLDRRSNLTRVLATLQLSLWLIASFFMFWVEPLRIQRL